MWLQETLEETWRTRTRPTRATLPNAQWLAMLSAASNSGTHGDSDCNIMQMLHSFDPTLCPAPPSHMVNWPTQAANQTADPSNITPSVCEQASTLSRCASYHLPHYPRYLRDRGRAALATRPRAAYGQCREARDGAANEEAGSIQSTRMRTSRGSTIAQRSLGWLMVVRSSTCSHGHLLDDSAEQPINAIGVLGRRSSLATSLAPTGGPITELREITVARTILEPVAARLASFLAFRRCRRTTLSPGSSASHASAL